MNRYSRLTLVFGGMLTSIEIFPRPLRSITQVLPFSTIIHRPDRTLVHFQLRIFGGLLLQQILTLVVASILMLLLYTFAFRCVTINGGEDVRRRLVRACSLIIRYAIAYLIFVAAIAASIRMVSSSSDDRMYYSVHKDSGLRLLFGVEKI